MAAVMKIPIDVWRLILEHVPPSPLLPPAEDDLINNVKLLSDDRELAVACAQYRTALRTVCRKWYMAVQPMRDSFLLLPGSTIAVPSVFRVQFPTTCECRVPGCLMANPPPLSSYKVGTQPLRAFLDASPQSERSVEDTIAMYTDLWLLSTAVDFSFFSLPSLSRACPLLTHLSFSEFHLPDSVQDQILDLPKLNTLILNFSSPGNTIPPPVPPTQVHHSYQHWRLPDLRNLTLKGCISNANPDFLDQINDILRSVGPTLQGLLYELWNLSETGGYILHPLPSSLWDWCPHLYTIQTALKILVAVPMPPPSHPRLTLVLHLGDLDTLPHSMSNLVWPQDLFQDVQNGTPWPIAIVRISTTWATFHRKLQRVHERPVNSTQKGQINEGPTNWPQYFWDWSNVLLGNGCAMQDRNGVDVSQGDGQVLVLWLRSINNWFFTPDGMDLDVVESEPYLADRSGESLAVPGDTDLDVLESEPYLAERFGVHVPNLSGQVRSLSEGVMIPGTFSTVFPGMYGDKKVAIKMLRMVKKSDNIKRKFRRELFIWWSLRHVNVLPLYGYFEDKEGGHGLPSLISKWAENDNAAQYVNRDLNWDQRASLFYDVAKGLSYLHGFKPIVVHADLKPQNVVVNIDGVGQLCDFGLTRFMQEGLESGLTTTTAYAGTTRYLAYELVEYEDKPIPTTATDMYALGCLGLEFIYRVPPHASLGMKLGRIIRSIGDGIPPAKRPANPEEVVPILWDLVEACWINAPEERPTAARVSDYLEENLEALSESLETCSWAPEYPTQ